MVRLQLSIKADLENVTKLVPASDDFEYFFKVKCNHCNEEHPKLVGINRIDEREITHGKGSTANFVWKCGLCKRESTAKFETTAPKPYDSENGHFQPLLVIECRNLEFVGFDPKGEWSCVGTESGTPFKNFELEDWTDYDEKAGVPVGITNFESRWDRAP